MPQDEIWFWLVAAGVLLLYGVFIQRVVAATRRRRQARAAKEAAFVEVLLKAAAAGAVSGIDQLTDLFRAHFEVNDLRLVDRYSLSQYLRKASLAIVAKGAAASNLKDLSDSLPLLRLLLAENDSLLAADEIRAPFSGTPTPERQLLEDVLELTKADKDLVRTKLSEVARAVTVREDTIRRLGEEGRQSLKWAKWGVVGTVAFSLISIALAVWAIGK